MDLPTVEIELERGEAGLGFNIRGGTDQPYIANDDGIFVTKIRDDGAAAKDGTLQLGDKILKINDQSVENVKHDTAVDLFIHAGNNVRLLVQQGAERAIMEKSDVSTNSRPEPEPESSFSTWTTVSIVVGAVLVAGVLYGFKYRGR
ncbi:synaptojanin-2-binding protein-like [Ptychodera flava]|uniref:synaptojanin-2-binding protein-like n=1 Tax=Ptychodera flava TaxID=63121 RepID=UPI003969DCE1